MVTINGVAYAISLGEQSAKVNGKQVDFSVQDGLHASGASAGATAASAAPAAPAGGESVVSPLPGLVLRLIAGDGDQVEADEDVLVLEAMKMEIPVKAPRAGHVSLVVAVGDKINSGDELFTIA